MMNTETLIEHNSRTVSLLKGKDFANAIEAAAEALNYQKAMIPSYPKLADETAQHPATVLDRCMLSSQNCEERTHDINGNAFFIYDQGISLMPNDMANGDDTSAILIFNTALAHQLYASTVLPSKSSAAALLLDKAKALYELAFGLHPVGSCGLFQFAIMNNMAVIEAILGNGPASKVYFGKLLASWMCIAANSPHQSQRLECMRGFLWNVLGGTGDNAASAA